MNQRTILTTLIGAVALSVFPAMPRASAQEALTYWYYQPGTAGTRQPRTGTGGHFVKLAGPTQVGGALVPGATIPVQTSVPSTYPSASPGLTYGLAFLDIQGGAEGDITVFPGPGGALPLTVNVTLPNTPNPQLAVNVYYFPEGGGPCPVGDTCGTAFIDEFGEMQGTLLDDTFVNVFIPPATTADAALTTTGNVDGTVSTGNNAARINADGTTPTGGNFDRWVSGIGGAVSGNDLNVGRGTTSYALALYHSACPSGYYWNPSATISECSPIPPPPTCPPGEVWNVYTKRCMRAPGGGGGCNMRCPAGQSCTEVGLECNCLRCSGGGGPLPEDHPIQ
jgi:hypothetical protein